VVPELKMPDAIPPDPVIIFKFASDPPSDHDLPPLLECLEPQFIINDDGQKVMLNEDWLILYKSCFEAVKDRDNRLKLWTDWVISEKTAQGAVN
jgi:hypothetical protein